MAATILSDPLRGSLREARERCNLAFEHAYLTMLLARTGGNITAASRMACTERRHLGRMIQRHGIDPSGFRGDDQRPVRPTGTAVREIS